MNLPDINSDWSLTYTGRKFYHLNPKPDQVCIEDIAHHLSLICRFGGACSYFYSVAQHSFLVASILPPAYKLCGLLHDATEAYYGDMVRPLKRAILQYQAVEEYAWKHAIAPAFGLQAYIPQIVHDADNVALVTERRDLMADNAEPWNIEAEPLKEVIRTWTPNHAERMFLKCYLQLQNPLPAPAVYVKP